MNILREILLILVVTVLYSKLSFIVALGLYTPDLIFIYILLRSLTLENIYVATLIGFLGGLVFDIFGGFPPGLSSITYSLTAFISTIFARERDNFTKSEIFTLSLSLLSFHYLVRYLDLVINLELYVSVFKHIVPLVLYTSAFQIIITYFLPFEKKRKML